ncbi:winged helix-turn-helix transcriptional regulator [Granulicella rosea]|uniref:winged helix-turn-helix transcriptional regulator n=1 Tax=Granulicella rosea TaxID=474952 RepID=UPI000B78FE9F|nr:winged helix-turn-helix domain-containing protein [Granulicella rosea]
MYRFGQYELDAERMILRGANGIAGLPPKALATLVALVERQGEVVSKQQLMEIVWPDSFVEEGNLTQSIFLLRRELGKTADGDDYIQTLPKRGYRFNVPVGLAFDEPVSETLLEEAAAPVAPGGGVSLRLWLGLVAAILIVAAMAILWRRETSRPQVSGYTQLTHDRALKRGRLLTAGGPDAALFTDGSRVFFTEGSIDFLTLAQVSAAGGETARIEVPFAGPQLLDVSQSHSELLVAGQAQSVAAATLWAIPVPAGSPRAIPGIDAWDASWSPDGRSIAYVNSSSLFLAKSDGTGARKLESFPGLAWMPRWSPDGSRLRLTALNVQGESNSLWEVPVGGGEPRPLLKGWAARGEPAALCCGSWTPDGREFVFQATRSGRSEIWSVPDRTGPLSWMTRSVEPVQLTGGQLSSLAPVVSPDGKKLFVIGQQLRGELERYDRGTGEFVSYLGGESMDFANLSRDGQWITYVAFPEGTLWRSRVDGSERLQLTFPPMSVMFPRWSPDGSQIVFYGGGGGPHRRAAYLVPATGGVPQPLRQGDGKIKEMMPNWSPDGSSILYSEFPFFSASPAKIFVHLLDLKTHREQTLPGSGGHFAAQWSPDGLYIAAISVRSQQIEIFDLQTKTWSAGPKGSGFLNWSRDSQYLYFLREGQAPAVVRLRVSDRKLEEVVSLKGMRGAGRLAGLEFGLTPEDDPFLLRDVGTQEIYSLDWYQR